MTMLRRSLSILLVVLVVAAAAGCDADSTEEGPSLDGTWNGEVQNQALESGDTLSFTIAYRLDERDGAVGGNMDLQGSFDSDAGNFTVQTSVAGGRSGDEVELRMQPLPVPLPFDFTFRGTLAETGERISGTATLRFFDAARTSMVPLVLERAG